MRALQLQSLWRVPAAAVSEARRPPHQAEGAAKRKVPPCERTPPLRRAPTALPLHGSASPRGSAAGSPGLPPSCRCATLAVHIAIVDYPVIHGPHHLGLRRRVLNHLGVSRRSTSPRARRTNRFLRRCAITETAREWVKAGLHHLFGAAYPTKETALIQSRRRRRSLQLQ